jgi:hypothetical protein
VVELWNQKPFAGNKLTGILASATARCGASNSEAQAWSARRLQVSSSVTAPPLNLPKPAVTDGIEM